ncbi:hypothetical protein Y032_0474g2118 [Ancylostoma ceylanicum]|uniref:Uncharacterized protein n=1 Tax=Ancylostoma ceylanicum TaxID=53326 RepID=A0A016WWQ4_9BILA|nr:hypothetical protein Y032_0474g2118 [Ancylostoma ceylanicum]
MNMMYVYLCLAPYEFNKVGVTGVLNVPIRVARLRAFSHTMIHTQNQKDFCCSKAIYFLTEVVLLECRNYEV